MGTEDTLFKTIGGFGLYQKIQFAIVALTSFCGVDIVYFNFISYSPDHWCKVNAQNGQQNLSIEDSKNLTIPWDYKANRYSQCSQYVIHILNTSEASFHLGTNQYNESYDSEVTTCDSWQFDDDSLFTHTTVTEWELVCDRAWLVDLLVTCHVMGVLVGSLTASLISDRFGRWKGTLIFLLIRIIGSLLSLVAPLFTILLFARVLVGIGDIGAYMDSFVLVLETTSPGHRTWMGVVISLMFSFGSMALTGYAYLVRDWRWVQLFSVVPAVVLTILTAFFIHESPRWLIQRGDQKKGIEILRKIGKVNGRPFFQKVETSTENPLQEKVKPSRPKIMLLKLFSSPSIRKYTFVCIAIWFTASLIFFALSLNANALSGDLFLNFLLLSAIEVPANLLAIVCLRSRLLGRRLTICFAYLLAGIVCFATIPLIVLHGKSHYTTALAIIGKFGITAAFSSIYIYTAELFPTEIRNLAVGVSSLAARVGAILAPYAGGSMGQVWTPLPSLIFGIVGTGSGLLVLLLPETRGTVLKDTIEEQETDL